jgi:acetyl esterase/lipase
LKIVDFNAMEFESSGGRDMRGVIIAERMRSLRAILLAATLLVAWPLVCAAALPAGAHVVRDVAYGADARQRMDVYLPQRASGAPVIFMVHGGGWRTGDKGARSVIDNKVARWVARGFIFVSAGYRMLPDTAPLDQARDVARAIATAQEKAASWGGDATKFIVMGHSAGAHLAALLAASSTSARDAGTKPWLGTVLLDSAALDVPSLMKARHARLYDDAFGADPAYWKAASPLDALSKGAAPLLAVCSSRRRDSCPATHRFAARAKSLGVDAHVLEENLSHREINERLGSAGHYTDAVESFMGSLDESVRGRLAAP